jgi:hypothetical protein
MICGKAACSGGTNRLSTLGAASENGEVLGFLQICDGDGVWRRQDWAFGTSHTTASGLEFHGSISANLDDILKPHVVTFAQPGHDVVN